MFEARWVALAHGCLDRHDAKTAVALLRYRPTSVVAVLDEANAGRVVEDVLGFGGPVPIVATLEQAAAFSPNRLLVGSAPAGGKLPSGWRCILLEALERGLDLWSGLHTFLAEDAELAERAERAGRRIVDLRAVPADLSTPAGLRAGCSSPVILTVGSDCNVGKMTVSWELALAARRQGLDARFVATGQTGVLLAGEGIAVDRVISDYVAGAAELLVVSAGGAELILVEGQGSLIHPFYSGVTLSLLHGSQPDAMILCHVCTRREVRHSPGQLIPPLPRLVEIYEDAAAWVKPARVVGVGLATYGLSADEARRELERAEQETDLPAEDVVRFPSGALLEACRRVGARVETP